MPNLIKSLRIERRMTPSQAASFIGINLASYWHLEGHDSEPWAITVMVFVRFCILYRVPPSALLPEDAFHTDKKWLTFERTQYGDSAIASTLKGFCQDTEQVAEEIGWEAEALTLWLSDEEQIGSMDLLALNDLCRYLNVSTSDVLDEFCSALGQRETML